MRSKEAYKLMDKYSSYQKCICWVFTKKYSLAYLHCHNVATLEGNLELFSTSINYFNLLINYLDFYVYNWYTSILHVFIDYHFMHSLVFHICWTENKTVPSASSILDIFSCLSYYISNVYHVHKQCIYKLISYILFT